MTADRLAAARSAHGRPSRASCRRASRTRHSGLRPRRRPRRRSQAGRGVEGLAASFARKPRQELWRAQSRGSCCGGATRVAGAAALADETGATPHPRHAPLRTVVEARPKTTFTTRWARTAATARRQLPDAARQRDHRFGRSLQDLHAVLESDARCDPPRDPLPEPETMSRSPTAGPESDELSNWNLLPTKPDWAGGIRDSGTSARTRRA